LKLKHEVKFNRMKVSMGAWFYMGKREAKC